jgi:hypothetical protein
MVLLAGRYLIAFQPRSLLPTHHVLAFDHVADDLEAVAAVVLPFRRGQSA